MSIRFSLACFLLPSFIAINGDGDKSICWTKPQGHGMPSHCGHHREAHWSDDSEDVIDLDQWKGHGYSQYTADGILWAIFRALGDGSKTFVEFGVQKGCECNTRWLRERCGWSGLLMDGRNSNATIGLHKEIVLSGGVVALFQKYQVPMEFDLLSIDIDDQDWHVWRTVTEAGYRPRVVIIEFQAAFGYPADWVPGKIDSLANVPPTQFTNSIPCKGFHDPNSRSVNKLPRHSASLFAFASLGNHLGYEFVHVLAPDMYFVRADVLTASTRQFQTRPLASQAPAIIPAECESRLVRDMGYRHSVELLPVASTLAKHKSSALIAAAPALADPSAAASAQVAASPMQCVNSKVFVLTDSIVFVFVGVLGIIIGFMTLSFWSRRGGHSYTAVGRTGPTVMGHSGPDPTRRFQM